MRYEFYCRDCDASVEEDHPMSEGPPETITCPVCAEQMGQNYMNKAVAAKVPIGWSDGKVVHQLHPRDPDRVVTSKNEMARVYKKKGISMDTGLVDNESKFNASLKKAYRTPGLNKKNQGKLKRETRNSR